jgi:multicomponent Na+:H+ antiporter subunit E
MGAIISLNLILRLTIWFLLTADFSLANLLIGIAIAWLLPGNPKSSSTLKDWLKILAEIIIAIPQAYTEAIQIMLRPHNQEDTIRQKVKPRRSPELIFLDIFLITFTPKTLVVKYDEQGWYEIHRVKKE